MKEAQFTAGSAWLDRALLRALNGDRADWPDEDAPDHAAAELRIRFHGVAYCLAQRLELLGNWPSELVEAVRSDARLQGLWESSHRHVVAQAVEVLAQTGIASAFNKGTALAYLAYPDPAMRQRGDSDLVIAPSDLSAARRVLSKAGWRCGFATPTQENWEFDTGAGFVHVIDLHWRATAVEGLRGLFDPVAALAEAVPLPKVSPSAQALDPVLLFLSGALNQAMHADAGYLVDGVPIYASQRLQWTMDSQLQASRFSPEQWANLVEQACARGMPRLCLAALDRARDGFSAPVPEAVSEALRSAKGAAPIDAFLFDMSTMERLRAGWRGAVGWHDRLTLLKRHLVMPEAALRRKYPGMAGDPLLLLHGRRLIAGAIATLFPASQNKQGRPE